MRRTFSMGGVHPHDCKISADSAIETFPLPQRMYISMSQHLGAPAKPLVQKGDKVRTGQLIGASAGFISANIHSSVSGTVAAVEPYADLAGNPVMHVIIDVEGDEWEESIDRTPDIVRDITMSPSEIVKRIADCGVVGLGGASFPTHVKLSPPPGKKAEFLIVNGAECEPYLTSDYRLMVEHTEEVLLGARIMMQALGVTKGYIGIEDNKPEAIRRMRELTAASYPEIEVVSHAVTGRKVPSMGLPIDAGVVVQNVGTSFAVYEAVQKNKPLFEGVMTVTGECLDTQHNFRLRVGTPFEKILEAVGGVPQQAAKIVSGGPMMGKAVSNLAAASVKSTSSLLLLTEKQTRRREEGECIRCGKCVQAGCCMFTCPAYIPLLDYIRTAKADVMRVMRSRPKK